MENYTISSSVYFLTEDEGGMRNHWFSGMKPSFNIDGNLIMCCFESLNNEEVIESGAHYDLGILIYDSYLVKKKLIPNAKFKLNIGGKVIAYGTIIDVF